MKKVYFSLLMACFSILTLNAIAQTTTYSTPGAYTFTCGSGYSAVTIDMAGAQGGASGAGAPGGKGGRVQATLTVSAGQVLYINVGGAGTAYSYCSARAGGANGGGTGYGYGGGGGGMSDIRKASGAFSSTNEYLVAGGGGGAGYNYGNNTEQGGDGGGLIGGVGYQGSPGAPTPSLCGSGGTQTAGGSGATSYGTPAGTFGQGGNCTGGQCYSGGGGGGWYGGGTGAYGGGGGGSSNLAGTGVLSATTTPAYQSGNGFVSITPLPPTVTAAPSSLAFGAVSVSTTSAPMITNLTGIALTGVALTLTPPANFLISLDGSTWSSTPLTYTYVGSTFSQILFVEFNPTAITSYAGNLAISGGGLAATVNVPLSGTGTNPCSGTPTAGAATINGTTTASGNSSTNFTLNVPSATVGGGITYQWQVSTTSSTGPWTNIGGANTQSYVYSGLAGNSWFQCVVSCGASSATSGTVSATFTMPGSSCTPVYMYNCSSYPMSCSINSLIGFAGSISDPGACGPNYVDNTGSMNVTLKGGTTYSITYGLSTSYYSSFAAQVWIDFNDNGVMESSETVGGFAQGAYSVTTPVGTITLPAGAAPGVHRMRIEGVYAPTSYSEPNYPSMTGCPTSSYYYGNTRDYKVIIPPPTGSLAATSVSPFGNVTVGTSSVPVAYTSLTGTTLTPGVGLLSVTAPANYQVSTTGSTWSNSVFVPYIGGTLTSKNVYVQFNPTAVSSYTGNVTVTGGGIPATVNVPVSGSGVATACSGAPTPGAASVTPTSGGGATTFTLSLPGVSAVGGLMFQWQYSTDGGTTWNNIANGIYATAIFTGIFATTQFRCQVSCGTGAAVNSTPVTATYSAGAMAASSCTPTFSSASAACSSYSMWMRIQSLIGTSGSIADATACTGTGYENLTASYTVTLSSNTTYSCTLNTGGSYPSSMGAQVWIDFNNNGIFESTESVGGYGLSTTSSTSPVITLTIPGGAPSGSFRMRVVGNYNCCGATTYPGMNPCPTTAITYGDVRDYTCVILGGALPCTGVPTAGIVSATPIASCSAFTANMFNVGEPSAPGSGLTYQWQTSSSPTTGFTNIAGATNASYLPAISSIGTVYFRDSVRCVPSATAAVSSSLGLTLNAAPTAITGTASICAGTVTTLSSTPGGGTWSSSNPAAVTINAATGVITGVSTGTSTITYVLSTGCFSTRVVTVNPQPSAITGSGTVCGSLTTALSSSPGGGTWTSSNTSLATVDPATGIVTGGASGNPTIVYTLPTGCSSSFPMTVNALSAITGTPSMCMSYTTVLADATPGGTWSSSTTGVATVNTTGVVTSVSIGTTTISYSIASTGCTATVLVAVTPPPSVYSMTGGGSYCSGTTGGVIVGLTGSNAGMSYTLFNGTTPVSSLIGAGFAFNFPAVFGAGIYTVVAGSGTPCATNMTGTSTVVINPLPTPYVVSTSGGGAYCAGGTGVHIYLNSSQIGINYQLFNGTTPVGGPISGTSAVLDFGLVTAGTYTITGYNTSTTCTGPMANSVTVSINPLPTPFTVTPSAGGYCAGGAGVTVGLSGSQTGVTYQLLLSGVPVTGAVQAGTGSALVFGLMTVGGTYTVQATNNTTGCSTIMGGSSVITVNPYPTVFSVTGGGGICPSGAGVSVGLNGSQAGVNYQLYRGGVLVTGSGYNLPGTGAALDYGLQTTPGAYTVVATNGGSGCASNMSLSANVVLNPAPTLFSVTPTTGSYCTGGIGVHVGLSGSVTGTNYTLYNGATIYGAASGTGSAVDFGLMVAGGTYTVVAQIVTTGCTGSMTGSSVINVNPLPTAFNVTVAGGGAYCAGGAGQVIGLSGSTSGINYQLFRGGVAVGTAVAGTGSAISFPAQTIAGSYTVVGTNTVTLCTNAMTGSASITVLPTPVTYTITGGGGFCSGGTGLHIGLAGSDIGINYQLYNTGLAVGAPVAGLGGVLDFGLFTTAGTYTVIGTNGTTSCTSTMTGSPVISINPLPPVNIVLPGGSTSFCAGGTGVAIGLNGSVTGINYQLYNGTTAVGAPVSGTTGSALSFGLQTAAGTYTAVATNPATTCSINMTGSTVVIVKPLPVAYNVTGGGGYCSGGTGMHVNLSNSVPGVKYQLFNTSGAVTGALLNGTGFALDFGLITVPSVYTVVATDTTTLCTNNMTGSVTISVNPLPTAFVIGGGGNYCAGTGGTHITLSNSTVGINYQLMIGTTLSGAPVSGTGSALDFGLRTAAGVYTVVATNATTGCTSNMTGSATIAINPLPTAFNVIGGGNYCPGGPGVHVGLSGSVTGTVYQLYNGASIVGAPISGTGAALDFGYVTATGTYTVVGTNLGTSCSGSMTGSVVVGVSPLPVVYNVTGTSNYCPGGAGSHVGLSGSSTGVSYQLFKGGIISGPAFTGTGSALDFGLQTTGTYTVIATGVSTTCSNNMNGSAVIGISPLPTLHSVTGGGNYCTGGTGLHVGLNGSDASTWYQLYKGSTMVGTPMAGTGTSLDFGLQTAPGVYTVSANSTSTTCSSTMSGSVTISTIPLPSTFSVLGGGNYCAGGAGVDITLSGSVTGVNYQLYNGTTAAGSSVSGSGSSIDFGMQTAAGTYTVVATDGTTLCTNNMTGSVTVVINPLPTPYVVTGGGNFCSGGTGVHVTLAGSDIGTTYQLFNSGIAVSGAIPGTGFVLDFGLQTAAGTYTVVGTNASTTCTGNMTGSVTINVNPLPTAYTVSGSGSSYCAGGAGIDVTLSGSDIGTNYQLYNGASPVGGAVAGTSGAIDFGYRTGTGTYTVIAINTSTTCSGSMTGAAIVAISPMPIAYTVTGGGSFCNGSTGVHVGLSGSNTGVLYQLYHGTAPVGSSIAGTGGPLDFGAQTAAGGYSVVATNTGSTCTNNMSGTVTITVNALPAPFNVTGGGNFCATGTGVPVGLSGSISGNSYQLYKSGIAVGSPLTGTGSLLDFGLKTAAGNYTVIATNSTTTCSNYMTGTVSVGVDPLPAAYSVTGGGNYCPGGSGVHVGLGNSATGTSYQLYRGTLAAGASIAGTGGGIDFGMQSTPGTYTVIATNGTTSCSSNMSGSVTVGINALPAVHSVIGGGTYCAGTGGIHIGLDGSDAGISYQPYNSYSATGTAVIGTGGPLDMGAETSTGVYTVLATDLSTGCSNNMNGTATVSAHTPVTPSVNVTTGVGDTLCSGSLTTFTTATVNGGTSPSYQWTVNGVVTGTGNHYTYIPLNGDVIGVTLTSNAQCATPAIVNNSMDVVVNNVQTPSVSIAANPGTEVCAGTSVNFTATPSAGGTVPTYSWLRNGANVGSSPVYSYIPANGDLIYCIMTSNYRCRTANTANSNQFNMVVDLAVQPNVSISVNPGTHIAAGQTAVMTASVLNGGPTPSYQWYVNGIPASGATYSVFVSSNLVDGDSVSCQVVSSGGCAGLTGANSVIIHVSGVGVNPVTISGSDVKLVPNPNNGLFTIKGNIGTIADQEVSLEVTNMLGQVVYTTKVIARNGDINEVIRLSNTLANGMYILNMHTETGNQVFHMVIEQ